MHAFIILCPIEQIRNEENENKNLVYISAFNEVVKSFDCCYQTRRNGIWIQYFIICTQRAIWIMLPYTMVEGWNNKMEDEEESRS